MADISSRIDIDVNTQSAIANLKALQAQFIKTNSEFAKANMGNAAAIRGQADIVARSIRNSRDFNAVYRDLTKTSEVFTRNLERNNFTARESFKYAISGLKGFSSVYQQESKVLDRVVRDRVKTMSSRFIQLGHDINGVAKGVQFKPTTRALSEFATATAMAAEKQAIMNKLLKQGSTSLINWGKNTQWAGRQLMVGFTLPLAYFGTVAAKTFMELEKQAIRFKRVYGDLFTTSTETEKALKDIENLAKQFTKYGVAVVDTMKLAADAAATGKMGAELIAQVTEATRLAVLGGVEQQEALETTISLTNAFGIAADNLSSKIDFLNAVENQTVVSIEDLTIAIPKAGPVVQQLGGDVEDLAFFLTAMKEGGINASEGANALKSGLASLINPTKKASQMLADLGIDIKGIVEANKGDIKNTVIGFSQALDTLAPLERARAIEQLFGKFQFARLSTLFQNVTKEGTQAARVLQLTTASVEELAILSERELKTVEDAIGTNFKEAVEQFKVSIAPIGKEFLKAVTPILEVVGKLFDKFQNLGEGPKKTIMMLTVGLGLVAPVVLMLVGLFGNLLGNLIKVGSGFRNFQKIITGQRQILRDLGLNTQYLSQEELEQQAIIKNLDSKHLQLTETLMLEKTAIQSLTEAYNRLAIAMSKSFPAARPPIGGGVPPVRKKKGGFINKVNKYEDGITFVPGPKGAGDIVPALLSPGEAVIPADVAQDPKNKPVIAGLISGKIQRHASGRTGSTVDAHASMPFATNSRQYDFAMKSFGPLEMTMRKLADQFPGFIRVVSNLTMEIDKNTNMRLRTGMPTNDFQNAMNSRVGKFNMTAAAGGANVTNPRVLQALNIFEKEVTESAVALAKSTQKQLVDDEILSRATRAVIDRYRLTDTALGEVTRALHARSQQIGQIRYGVTTRQANTGLLSGQFVQSGSRVSLADNPKAEVGRFGSDRSKGIRPMNAEIASENSYRRITPRLSAPVIDGNVAAAEQQATQFATQFASRIRVLLTAQGQELGVSAGRWIGLGLQQGVQAGATAAGQQAKIAFNRGLGVASPPKWSYDDGDWIAEGVTAGTEKGMASRSQRIKNAVKGTVDKAAKGVTTVGTAVGDAGKRAVSSGVAKVDEKIAKNQESQRRFREAAEKRLARALNLEAGLIETSSGTIRDKRVAAQSLVAAELESATEEERFQRIKQELNATTRRQIRVVRAVTQAEIEFFKAVEADRKATTEETKARVSAAKMALQLAYADGKLATATNQATASTMTLMQRMRQTGTALTRVNPKISNFASKASGATMGLSMLTMFGSMMPGQIGEFSRSMSMFMMGLSAVLMLLPALATPLGMLTVVIGGTIAAFKFMSFRVNKARTKAMELETAMGATAEAITEMGKITKKVSAGEIMDRRRRNRAAMIAEEPGRKTFGETYLESEGGKNTLKNVGQSIKEIGKSGAIQKLALQMGTMVASGVMTSDQARSVVEQVGLQLKDSSFAINAEAQLIKLLDPQGKDLTIDPMTLRVNLITESTKQLDKTMQTQMKKIQDFRKTNLENASPVGGVAAGAGVGAGTGAMIGTAIFPGVGTAIGAVVGTIAGAITGGIIGNRAANQRKNELIASTGGSIVGQNAIQLQQRKQILDSIRLEYETQLATLKTEKERADLREKYLKDTQKILDESAKSAKILDQLFNVKKEGGSNQAGPGQNDPDKVKLMNEAVTAARELALKKFKNDPALKAVAEGVLDTTGAMRNERGKRDQNTQRVNYMISMAMANGELDPIQAQQLLNTFGSDTKALNKVLNYSVKFGGDFLQQTGTALSFFSEATPEIQKQLVMSLGFDANGKALSLEEAQETLNLFTSVGQLSGTYDVNVVAKYLTENTKVQEKLEKITKIIDDNKGKLTLDFAFKTAKAEGSIDVLAGKVDEWQKKYLEGLNPEQQQDQIVRMAGIYNNIWTSTYAEDEQNFLAYLASQRELAFRSGKERGEVMGDAFVQATRLKFSSIKFEDYMRLNPIPPATGNKKTTGTGTRDTFFDETLKKLKLVQQGSIKTTGGIKELLRVMSKKTKFNALNQFDGLVQKLLKVKDINLETINFVEALAAEGMDKDLAKIGVRIDKVTNKLIIFNKEKFKAFDTAQGMIAFGDINAKAAKDIEELNTKTAALNRLRRMGISYQEASEMASNNAVAAGILSGEITQEAIKKQNALLQQRNRLEEYYQKITNVKAQDQAKKNAMVNEQLLQYVELQNKLAENTFLIRKTEIDLENEKNSLLLEKIQYEEDLVNRIYDKQLQALDEMKKRQEEINQLQEQRLSLAQALSRGDMAGAAQAIQTIRQQEAAAQIEERRKRLEDSKQKALKSITAGGKTREQIELDNTKMQKEITDLNLEIFKMKEEIRKTFKQNNPDVIPEQSALYAELVSALEGLPGMKEMFNNPKFVEAMKRAVTGKPGEMISFLQREMLAYMQRMYGSFTTQGGLQLPIPRSNSISGKINDETIDPNKPLLENTSALKELTKVIKGKVGVKDTAKTGGTGTGSKGTGSNGTGGTGTGGAGTGGTAKTTGPQTVRQGEARAGAPVVNVRNGDTTRPPSVSGSNIDISVRQSPEVVKETIAWIERQQLIADEQNARNKEQLASVKIQERSAVNVSDAVNRLSPKVAEIVGIYSQTMTMLGITRSGEVKAEETKQAQIDKNNQAKLDDIKTSAGIIERAGIGSEGLTQVGAVKGEELANAVANAKNEGRLEDKKISEGIIARAGIGSAALAIPGVVKALESRQTVVDNKNAARIADKKLSSEMGAIASNVAAQRAGLDQAALAADKKFSTTSIVSGINKPSIAAIEGAGTSNPTLNRDAAAAAKKLESSKATAKSNIMKPLQSAGERAAAQFKSLYGSMGGLVPKYFANGGFTKGTDIIPAMLTPGEFIVRKEAVDSLGIDTMGSINQGKVPVNSNSVYNYGISVNVNNSNANPNDIARTVINQIKQIDAQRIRSYR